MMMHPKRALVRATLRRRGSERKPMPWCSFDLVGNDRQYIEALVRFWSNGGKHWLGRVRGWSYIPPPTPKGY